jgi:rhomboid family GlyGly-CTERM serine protease
MWLLLSILAGANAPLLVGGSTAALAFLPARFADGEWWRLATHPFVHVSLYHLALDGAAVLFLWPGAGANLWARLRVFFFSAVGSLLAAALLSPAFETVGLCGLSGVAHGLMAKQGLDLWSDSWDHFSRRLGMALFFGVLAKAVVEVWTGGALFAAWHLGELGTPIVACHLGGVVGACLAQLGGLARQDRRRVQIAGGADRVRRIHKSCS